MRWPPSRLGRVARDGDVWLDRGTLYASYCLAHNARQEDVDEWAAGTGEPLSRALPCAWERSLVCRCLWYSSDRYGFPLAMWGCTPTDHEDVRQVWFVAHEMAPQMAIAIHRHFRQAVSEMQPPGVSLRAFSYWRNIKHHRWLETHGFALQAVHASPATGIPYLSFVRGPP